MPWILKWFLYAVIGLFALLVATATLISVILDPNDYRDDIAAAVQEETGRELTIDGDIRLSFFPWLGVEAGRVTLADRDGFHEDPFLEVERVDAAVRLLPLLWGQLETRLVSVEAPIARLMINEEGEGNWEDLVARFAEEEEPPAEPTDGAPLGELPPILRDAAFGGLQVRRGQLFWEDRSIDDRKEVERFDLDIEALRLGRPVAVQSSWVGQGEDLPRIDGQLRLQATLDEALEQFDLDGLEMLIEAQGAEVPGRQQRLGVTGHGSIGLGETLRVDWPELEATAAGITLQAAADLEMDEDGAFGGIDWQLPAFNLRTALSRLDVGMPTPADATALTRVGGTGRIELDGQQLLLPEFGLDVDQSRIELDGGIENWTGPAMTLNLTVDEINLDRYLPAEQRRAVDEPTAPDTGLPDLEEVALDLPLEPLRTLALNGGLEIGALTLSGLLIEDIRGDLSGKDGRVGIAGMEARLYEGEYRAATFLDARGDYPYFELDHRLDNVRFAPLLEDLLERDWLHGRGRFALRGEGGGENLYQLIEDFRGDAELDVSEGAVLGLNIPHMFREGVARVRAQPRPEPPEDEARTDFGSLTAGFELRDGEIHNDNLRAESPILRARGAGHANVLSETIDYRVRLSVIDNLEDADGRPIRELKDITVPLEFSGDLFSPRIRFDLRAALTEQEIRRLREAQQRLEEAEEKVREGFRERIEQELEEQTDRAEDRIRQEAESFLRRLR
ncbi:MULTISPECIES: AsmA family protein [Halorhodospira]|uniref:AsmA family protein n=1 Tax=Halorhodospira TaxID=85108 RepID=UPI0019127036|nr:MULTISPECIES: AsmA family protein [Halorhodospira]MCG5527048.1 AsmA family protein [Halorhodospira halophila]MCG5542615.1 AsmA family protein [Halorhodospira sp. 9628]